MNDNITSIASTTLADLPEDILDIYKSWILNRNLSPSSALNMLMSEYRCPNPDSSVIIRLIEYTYPEIDISRNNFTFKISDSEYPYIKNNMSDMDFDELVREMRSLEPGW